jgi:hypothetical protein
MKKSDQNSEMRRARAGGIKWRSGDAGRELSRVLGGIGAAPDFAAFGERMDHILRELCEAQEFCGSNGSRNSPHGRD